MQDLPNIHMRNHDMTGDSPHTGTEMILYLIQPLPRVVWHSYSSITFLCVHNEGSAVGQPQVQVCKEDVAGCLPPGITLSVQPMCNLPLQSAVPYAYHQVQQPCSVPSYYHFVGRLNETSYRAWQQKPLVRITVI
ncbi:uncharacterized protein TNCV_4835431 [Trichonephila clavipes]|nr:uncharacterized protein TNCV_4835431 [Trichonephila clavipes]